MAESGFAKSGIAIKCAICGSWKELTESEAEESRHFNSSASIYICDGCKEAIQWAKRQHEKSKEKNNG